MLIGPSQVIYIGPSQVVYIGPVVQFDANQTIASDFYRKSGPIRC
ncbi:hypothetical protein [Cytobacillus dafuensis]|nr:hypothetical protein [Cytobacillus dafuensis]